MRTNSNSYTNRRIEFHILQAFPVTCLNRDDVGAPKTAVVGGVTRARVSSQCWKRAVRLAMHEISGVELGCRTKRIEQLVSDACRKLGADEEKAAACGKKVEDIFIKKSGKKKDEEDTKSDTLIFLASSEVEAVAQKFKENDFLPEKVITEKDPEKSLAAIIGRPKFASTAALDGLDIALFGRMVAQATSMNVEGAASFNHAISTHKVTNEVEFFTALDDLSDSQGSAHMGSLEFNSAVYYRYICLDLGQLYENLGGSDEFLGDAVTAFIKALYAAVPAARQNTQSGASGWDYAKVFVRKGQRLQLSCETPVPADTGGGYLQPSIEYLKEELKKKEKLSGSLFGKIKEFEFGSDENYSIDSLISDITAAAKA